MSYESIPDRPSNKVPIWHPKDLGDTLEGVIIRINDKYGETPKKAGRTQITIQTATGEFRTPSPMQLLQKLEDARLELGHTIRIMLKELKQTGQSKPMQLFDVSVDRTKQTTIPSDGKTALDEPTDAAGQLLKALACSTAGINDKDFWKHVEHLTGGNLAGGMALVQHLKEQGKLYQDKDGFWKAWK